MEKTYTTTRTLRDGTVKTYEYKKVTKGCPKRGAQLTVRGMIARKIKDVPDDNLNSILEFINNLQITPEAEDD
jgi:hypothetical protein